MKTPLRVKIWAAIRNNPGIHQDDLRARFPEVKRGSFSSILSALENSDAIYSHLIQNKKHFYTKYQSYITVRKLISDYRNNVKGETPMKEETPPYTIRVIKPEPIVETEQPIQENKVDSLLNTLTINEGRELYKKLHTIFHS